MDLDLVVVGGWVMFCVMLWVMVRWVGWFILAMGMVMIEFMGGLVMAMREKDECCIVYLGDDGF